MKRLLPLLLAAMLLLAAAPSLADTPYANIGYTDIPTGPQGPGNAGHPTVLARTHGPDEAERILISYGPAQVAPVVVDQRITYVIPWTLTPGVILRHWYAPPVNGFSDFEADLYIVLDANGERPFWFEDGAVTYTVYQYDLAAGNTMGKITKSGTIAWNNKSDIVLYQIPNVIVGDLSDLPDHYAYPNGVHEIYELTFESGAKLYVYIDGYDNMGHGA